MFNYSRKKRRINRFVLLILSVIILLAGFNRIGVFDSLKSVFEKKVVIPFRVQRYNKTREEIDLKDLLTRSINNAAELRAEQLLEENRQLKNMMGIALPKEWRYIEAPVIEYGNDRLVVARGSDGGVSLGMPAIVATDKPILIGKVSDLSANQAVISLPSDYDSRLSVVLVSSDNNGDNLSNILGRGLAVGQGGGGILVDQILNQENVIKGNLVAYRYDDKLLLIGTVADVNMDTGGVFKSAMVDPAIVPFKLLNVFLVDNKDFK